MCVTAVWCQPGCTQTARAQSVVPVLPARRKDRQPVGTSHQKTSIRLKAQRDKEWISQPFIQHSNLQGFPLLNRQLLPIQVLAGPSWAAAGGLSQGTALLPHLSINLGHRRARDLSRLTQHWKQRHHETIPLCLPALAMGVFYMDGYSLKSGPGPGRYRWKCLFFFFSPHGLVPNWGLGPRIYPLTSRFPKRKNGLQQFYKSQLLRKLRSLTPALKPVDNSPNNICFFTSDNAQ